MDQHIYLDILKDNFVTKLGFSRNYIAQITQDRNPRKWLEDWQGYNNRVAQACDQKYKAKKVIKTLVQSLDLSVIAEINQN